MMGLLSRVENGVRHYEVTMGPGFDAPSIAHITGTPVGGGAYNFSIHYYDTDTSFDLGVASRIKPSVFGYLAFEYDVPVVTQPSSVGGNTEIFYNPDVSRSLKVLDVYNRVIVEEFAYTRSPGIPFVDNPPPFIPQSPYTGLQYSHSNGNWVNTFGSMEHVDWTTIRYHVDLDTRASETIYVNGVLSETRGNANVVEFRVDFVARFFTEFADTIDLRDAPGLVAKYGVPSDMTRALGGNDDVYLPSNNAGNSLLGISIFDAGGGNDTIRGGGGDDKIQGAEGNDVFVASRGADSMSGGSGGDTFDYSEARSLGTIVHTLDGGAHDLQPDTIRVYGDSGEYLIKPDGDGYLLIRTDGQLQLSFTGVERVEFVDDGFSNVVSLTDNNLLVELATLANEVYAPTAAIAGRGWHPLSDLELGGDISVNQGVYSSSLPLGGDAKALVLVGEVQGVKTLAVSFAGTDVSLPDVDYDDLEGWFDTTDYYEHFRALIDVLIPYISEPAHRVEQVLVTGHSLGGSMVQHFIDELQGWFPQDPEYESIDIRGVTFGSIGAETFFDPVNLVNIFHPLDIGRAVPALSVRDRSFDPNPFLPLQNVSGYDVVADRADLSNSPLDQHYMSNYLETVRRLLAAPAESLPADLFFWLYGFEQGLQDDHSLNIGSDGSDSLRGSELKDLINGGAGSDSIAGLDGADTLAGGAGNDTVMGGEGNDFIIAGSGEGDDRYEGEAGVDTLRFTSTSLGVTVDLALGTARGSEIGLDTILTSENVVGGGGADTLLGDHGANRISGESGNDRLDGRSGNDTLVGSSGNNTLTGGAGSDEMYAGRGQDSLSGGDGNDTLAAGGGVDTVSGGRGQDLYLLEASWGRTAIIDFRRGEDTLHFLEGTGVESFTDMMAHAVQSGANVVISTSAGDILQLNNVLISSLQPSDFLFG